MSRQNSILLFVGSTILILFMYILSSNAKSSYFEEADNIVGFESEAKSLASLKKRFDKKSVDRVISSLNRISMVTKDYKKSNSRVLLYENLAPSSLGGMLRKIENSTLLIKKLEITRTSPSNAILRLEIKK